MEEIAVLFIIGGIFLVLSGPAALVISIIALSKVNSIAGSIKGQSPVRPAGLDRKASGYQNEEKVKEDSTAPAMRNAQKQEALATEQEIADDDGQKSVNNAEQITERSGDGEHTQAEYSQAEGLRADIYNVQARSQGGLELTIGTRWLLVAGAITLLAGMAFFVKYAYDNWSIGPMGRILVCAGAGFFGLLAGEITRRKGYDFTAKGTTAIGFGLLYTAVFAGQGLYGLFPAGWAFGLAVLITAAAAVYAVVLNEQMIGLLSLAGGFLTPILISTSENMPNQLFGYLFIISAGMMVCSYIRKWRLIDAAAFAGVIVLYTLWFEKYYYIWQVSESVRIFTALGWYGAFFGLFTLRSVAEPLIKKTKGHPWHLLVIGVNAVYACYILHEVLYDDYRLMFGHTVIGLAVLHLGFLISAYRRCREDSALIDVLLAAVVLYPTVAAAVYLEGAYKSLAWSVEFAVLAVISKRIKRVVLYAACAGVLLLSWAVLWLNYVPLHKGSFEPFVNSAFISWVFLGVCMLIVQGFYRAGKVERKDVFYRLAGVLYGVGICIIGVVCSAEWFGHCYNNLANSENMLYITGQLVIAILGVFAFSVRPVSVDRGVSLWFLGIWSAAGIIFALVYGAFGYERQFELFVNPEFGISLLLGLSILAGAYFLTKGWESCGAKALSRAFICSAIIFIWMLISEQIYVWFYCMDRYGEGLKQWFFAGHMYVSLFWAGYAILIMTAGFLLKLRMVRYISLGIFGSLLVKILIVDMHEIESFYRIGAFVLTGLVLVGVSFGYQHLKKKGYFELNV